jgi:hypothetical protein
MIRLTVQNQQADKTNGLKEVTSVIREMQHCCVRKFVLISVLDLECVRCIETKNNLIFLFYCELRNRL